MTVTSIMKTLNWPVLMLSALLAFALPTIAADKAATEAQLKALREQISELQKEQTTKRKKESAARQELAEAESRIGEVSKALDATQQKQREAKHRLNNLDDEKQRYEQQRDKALKTLAKQMRAAFTVGDQEYLKLLLNQQDPSRLGRTLIYYEYLNKARTVELQQLAEAMQSLSTIAETIAAELLELKSIEQKLSDERQQLKSLSQKRRNAVRRLAQEIASTDKKIASLQADEQSLGQLLEQIGKAAKRVPLPKGAGFPQLRGRLSWPSNGKLLHQYGESRHEGRLRWNGVLIGGREGGEVSAIYHGRIVFSDWLRGFGLMTIVDHGDDYMSLYGHNQSLLKKVGDWVEAGEPIATIGNTGGQTDVGLYFEIRHQGKAIDPRPWIAKGG
ncbi:hypothetical protein E2H98_10835 [Permianibacter aggregans]|nr:hypothetical protein E2H98_10835 [Permianibacter aggregans]